MRLFESFENIRDVSLLKETPDQGARDSMTRASFYDDKNDDSLESDNRESSGKVVVVNKYNPDKRFLKEDRHWLPETQNAVANYMDMTDYNTLNVVSVMNEEEQNTLLVNLTNKLYKLIVEKVDQVDFGEIPNTKGDITRLSKYKELRECIDVLRNIFIQYREKTEPVEVLQTALNNIEDNKDLFVASYASKINLGITIYNTTTLALINATSFMIAVCIEYIKTPGTEGLHTVLNKTGIAKVKDHLLYENLVSFNDSCKNGEIEGAIKPLIHNRARGFATTAILGFKAVLIVGSVLIALIPMLRNLAYFFYSTRSRVSKYFDLQAKLLEMNAEELKNNSAIKTEDDKKEVIRRQLAIANTFHKIADSIAVDAKTSEREATNKIKEDRKEYKIDEIDNAEMQDPEKEENNGGSLF